MNERIISTDRRTYITLLEENKYGTAFIITKFYTRHGKEHEEVKILATLKMWIQEGTMNFDEIMNNNKK